VDDDPHSVQLGAPCVIPKLGTLQVARHLVLGLSTQATNPREEIENENHLLLHWCCLVLIAGLVHAVKLDEEQRVGLCHEVASFGALLTLEEAVFRYSFKALADSACVDRVAVGTLVAKNSNAVGVSNTSGCWQRLSEQRNFLHKKMQSMSDGGVS